MGADEETVAKSWRRNTSPQSENKRTNIKLIVISPPIYLFNHSKGDSLMAHTKTQTNNNKKSEKKKPVPKKERQELWVRNY